MTPQDTRMGPEEHEAAARPGRRPDLRTGLIVVVAVILIGWALRAAAVVLVPLVASVLIALAVMPVRDAVRRRVPDKLSWLGIVAAATVLLLVIGLFFGGLWLAAQRIVAELPAQPGQVAEQIQGAGVGGGVTEGARVGATEGAAAPQDQDPGPATREEAAEAEDTDPAQSEDAAPGTSPSEGGGIGGLLDAESGLLRTIGDRAAGAASGVAITILNSGLSIVAGLVLIFFLTLLMLIESGDWRRKLQTAARPPLQWRLSESVEVIAGKVRTYLLVRTVLGVITAALYAIWLWFFGVGLILVWALLTFLLNFVPTIGSLIAGLLPVIYAFLTQDFGTALLVGLGLLVIEQIMGNYVDPRLAGREIAISPLVILLALLFWSWVWGIPGALLAAPVTVALVVLGAHVPALRPWALLLSDRTTMPELDEATRPE